MPVEAHRRAAEVVEPGERPLNLPKEDYQCPRS